MYARRQTGQSRIIVGTYSTKLDKDECYYGLAAPIMSTAVSFNGGKAVASMINMIITIAKNANAGINIPFLPIIIIIIASKDFYSFRLFPRKNLLMRFV